MTALTEIQTRLDAVLVVAAELKAENERLRGALTRIDTLSRYDNHPRSRSARDAAIKAAVELINEGRSNGKV